MRKFVLFSLALAVTFNAYAVAINKSLSDTITKKLNKQSSTHNSSIYYGGKDFSHPVIASANENESQAKPVFAG